jgi:hypothetical protein
MIVEESLGLLREVAYAGVLSTVDDPGRGRFLVTNDAQQRRLARPIRADQRDLGLIGNGKRQIGKDILRTI